MPERLANRNEQAREAPGQTDESVRRRTRIVAFQRDDPDGLGDQLYWQSSRCRLFGGCASVVIGSGEKTPLATSSMRAGVDAVMAGAWRGAMQQPGSQNNGPV